MINRNIFKRAAICAAAVAGTVMLTAAVKDDFGAGRNMELLINMFRDLNTYYVDGIDPDRVMQDAAAGMVSSLDPYTEYLPEEEMKNFSLLTTGKYGGVGSLIRKKDDYVRFAQPYKDYPADRAGIRIGDRILEIDGEPAKGFSTEEVSNRLKGDPGTSVRLKVGRLLDDSVFEVTLQRERISISGVPYYGWAADGIGYIEHNDFSEDCSSDMRRAVMQLRESGDLRGLVIDLRGNGGGIVQEAVKILSMFLPKGSEVLSMKGRQESSDAVFRTEQEPIDVDLPIVVLTDSGTASAAEIVSGALQDKDRAVLLGRRTFGKGLVQSTLPLGYNAFLKVTTAKYYMPSGRCIQAIDYAHRNDDGSVGYVPDSLVREFRTAAGRKVYDGGGIMPDVLRKAEYASRFAVTVYAMGFIDDFVDEYVKRNDQRLRSLDPTTFSISDSDYDDFVDFMADKKIEYRSQSSQFAEQLRQAAERELFDSTVVADIARLEKSLRDDNRTNLLRYRDELRDAINSQVILHYAYSDGVTKYNLLRDKDVKAAIKLLEDEAEYRRILAEQDTSRSQNQTN